MYQQFKSYRTVLSYRTMLSYLFRIVDVAFHHQDWQTSGSPRPMRPRNHLVKINNRLVFLRLRDRPRGRHSGARIRTWITMVNGSHETIILYGKHVLRTVRNIVGRILRILSSCEDKGERWEVSFWDSGPHWMSGLNLVSGKDGVKSVK